MPDFSYEKPPENISFGDRFKNAVKRITGAADRLKDPQEIPGVEFNKTILVQYRLRDDRFFEEPTPDNRYGVFRNRRIIGRDVPINKGVYLGGSSREAIVVDDEKMPTLDILYGDLQWNIKSRGGDYKTESLSEVFKLVSKELPFSETEVARIAREKQLEPDDKIGIDVYIGRGGVCRHQALLCAYLLERLCHDGYLGGKVSVDRNYVEGKGGHAWCRYTSKSGKVFILDVAQGYKGHIEDVDTKWQWFYKRPGEK